MLTPVSRKRSNTNARPFSRPPKVLDFSYLDYRRTYRTRNADVTPPSCAGRVRAASSTTQRAISKGYIHQDSFSEVEGSNWSDVSDVVQEQIQQLDTLFHGTIETMEAAHAERALAALEKSKQMTREMESRKGERAKQWEVLCEKMKVMQATLDEAMAHVNATSPGSSNADINQNIENLEAEVHRLTEYCATLRGIVQRGVLHPSTFGTRVCLPHFVPNSTQMVELHRLTESTRALEQKFLAAALQRSTEQSLQGTGRRLFLVELDVMLDHVRHEFDEKRRFNFTECVNHLALELLQQSRRTMQ